MKTAITSLLLLVSVLSTVALSQQTTCPSNDPTLHVIDTIRTSVQFPGPGGELSKGQQGNTGVATFEIMVYRTGDGPVQYSILPNSFRFAGDPVAIDGMGTREIFRMAEQAAIAQGILAGYTVCTQDCQAVTVRVCQTACVRRIGSGIDTRFEPCDPNACCIRTYQVCCPDGAGAPVTHLLSVEGAQCAGGVGGGGECESVCR